MQENITNLQLFHQHPVCHWYPQIWDQHYDLLLHLYPNDKKIAVVPYRPQVYIAFPQNCMYDGIDITSILLQTTPKYKIQQKIILLQKSQILLGHHNQHRWHWENWQNEYWLDPLEKLCQSRFFLLTKDIGSHLM